jgi:signal transduction histidine kinase
MSSSWLDRLRHTLGFRLALWYALLFVAGSVLLGALTYALLDSSLAHRDHELIGATLDRYVGEYRRGGIPRLNEAIATDRVAGRHERLFVRVLGRDAEAVFLNTPSDWQGADLARLAPDTTGWAQMPARGVGAVLEVASVQLPDGTLFQVGKSSEGRVELLDRFRSLSALLLGSTVALGILGGVALTWSALRPVRDLAAAVRRIVDTGEMSARVPVSGHRDPLDELSGLFNGMLDRIETLIAGLEGSLDNVAHDLRTPLARLRLSTEMGESDEALKQGMIADIGEMDSIIGQFLDFARTQSEEPLEPTDVAALAREVVEHQLRLGHAVQTNIETVPLRSLRRMGIKRLISNLVDNALAYGEQDVCVATRSEGGKLIVEVLDRGPGIPPQQAERLKQPFTRLEQARSGRGGSGLGLAIVDRIARHHGGSFELLPREGGGLVARVSLPLQEGAALPGS